MQHWQQRVYSNEVYDYYVKTDGTYYKTHIESQRIYPLAVFWKEDSMQIKIKTTNKRLSRVMASLFMREFNPRIHMVGFKDGDKTNCSLDNLYLYERIKHDRKNGKARARRVVIEYKDQKKIFLSIRAASRAIGLHHSTLSQKLRQGEVTYKGARLYYEVL